MNYCNTNSGIMTIHLLLILDEQLQPPPEETFILEIDLKGGSNSICEQYLANSHYDKITTSEVWEDSRRGALYSLLETVESKSSMMKFNMLADITQSVKSLDEKGGRLPVGVWDSLNNLMRSAHVFLPVSSSQFCTLWNEFYITYSQHDVMSDNV